MDPQERNGQSENGLAGKDPIILPLNFNTKDFGFSNIDKSKLNGMAGRLKDYVFVLMKKNKDKLFIQQPRIETNRKDGQTRSQTDKHIARKRGGTIKRKEIIFDGRKT